MFDWVRKSGGGYVDGQGAGVGLFLEGGIRSGPGGGVREGKGRGERGGKGGGLGKDVHREGRVIKRWEEMNES